MLKITGVRKEYWRLYNCVLTNSPYLIELITFIRLVTKGSLLVTWNLIILVIRLETLYADFNQVFVAASHQTRLDTRSKARRPIKVGIKGRGGEVGNEPRLEPCLSVLLIGSLSAMWAWWGKQFHEPKCGSGPRYDTWLYLYLAWPMRRALNILTYFKLIIFFAHGYRKLWSICQTFESEENLYKVRGQLIRQSYYPNFLPQSDKPVVKVWILSLWCKSIPKFRT